MDTCAFAEAARCYRRLVRARPVEEHAWQGLIRSLIEIGERLEAVRVYEGYRDRLAARGMHPPADLAVAYRKLVAAPLGPAPELSPAFAGFEPVGGAVPLSSPYYIERTSDAECHAALDRHDSFVLIRGARQMGKSSLMVRTAARLREAGRTVVALDLTTVGRHVTIEQWYSGLLWSLGRQLGIEDALDDFWQSRERLAPLQRFVAAICDVALQSLPSDRASLVVFVDEIDLVRSLPFSADEFFGAIREIAQRRHSDPKLGRVCFCLLGVAAPTDLIENADMTPFNIGRRIELNDFTAEEAMPLVAGIEHAYGNGDGSKAEAALKRVLWWTNGHPYLTQRLCAAIAAEPTAPDKRLVDVICGRLFLGAEAQATDTNLAFVAQQMVGPEERKVRVLTLYDRILRGAHIASADTGEAVQRLRLSGIVKPDDGHLRVRNRIYERVFCRRWVADHLPDQELRRQRMAYRRGVIRASIVAAVVIAVVAALAGLAWHQSRVAAFERDRARANLYVAEMNLAERALAERNTGRPGELLDHHIPQSGEWDRRGFEWRYWWGLINEAAVTLHPSAGLAFDVRVSPDGRRLASAHADGAVRVYDTFSRAQVATLRGHAKSVLCVRFSPDGRRLASGSEDGSVRVWATDRWVLERTLRHQGGVPDMAWSADGRVLVTTSWEKAVRGWDAVTGEVVWQQQFPERVEGLACAPKSDLAVLACRTGDVSLIRARSGTPIRSINVTPASVGTVAFSPDGTKAAVGYGAGSIRILRTPTLRPIASIRVGDQHVDDIAWSPDGTQIAVASWDTAIHMLEAASLRETRELLGHRDMVSSVTWMPDGRTLASAGGQTVKLWDMTRPPQSGVYRLSGGQAVGNAFINGETIVISDRAGTRVTPLPWCRRPVTARPLPDGVRWAEWNERAGLYAILTGPRLSLHDEGLREVRSLAIGAEGDFTAMAWSPDGTRIAVAAARQAPGIELLDAQTLRTVKRFDKKPHDNVIQALAWSPDGQLLVSCGWDGKVVVRDLLAGTSRCFQAAAQSVNAGAFSPCGRTFVTGDDGSMLRLWNVATWTEVARMRLPDHVLRVSFTPDGRYLTALHIPGVVRWWRAPALTDGGDGPER